MKKMSMIIISGIICSALLCGCGAASSDSAQTPAQETASAEADTDALIEEINELKDEIASLKDDSGESEAESISEGTDSASSESSYDTQDTVSESSASPADTAVQTSPAKDNTSAQETPAADSTPAQAADSASAASLTAEPASCMSGNIVVELADYSQTDSTVTVKITNNSGNDVKTFGHPSLIINGQTFELNPFQNMGSSLSSILSGSYATVTYTVDGSLFENGGTLKGQMWAMNPLAITDNTYSLNISVG